MTNHLFIAGPSDGRYHDVEPDVQYHRVEGPPAEPAPRYSLGPVGLFPPVVTYRRERFAIGKHIAASIFVANGVSTDTMFRLLLEGYRQGLPPDPPEQFVKGYELGRKAGIRESIARIETDNPMTSSPAWEVFRGRAKRMLADLLKGTR